MLLRNKNLPSQNRRAVLCHLPSKEGTNMPQLYCSTAHYSAPKLSAFHFQFYTKKAAPLEEERYGLAFTFMFYGAFSRPETFNFSLSTFTAERINPFPTFRRIFAPLNFPLSTFNFQLKKDCRSSPFFTFQALKPSCLFSFPF